MRTALGKAWRGTSEEARRPYVEEAREVKRRAVEAEAAWREGVAVWEREAERVRREVEGGSSTGGGGGRVGEAERPAGTGAEETQPAVHAAHNATAPVDNAAEEVTREEHREDTGSIQEEIQVQPRDRNKSQHTLIDTTFKNNDDDDDDEDGDDDDLESPQEGTPQRSDTGIAEMKEWSWTRDQVQDPDQDPDPQEAEKKEDESKHADNDDNDERGAGAVDGPPSRKRRRTGKT